MLSKLGRLDEALQDAEKALDVKPDWAKGYFRKGRILQQMGKHMEAFVAFYECLSLEVACDGSVGDAVKEASNELFYILKAHCRKSLDQETVGSSETPGAPRRCPSVSSWTSSGISSLNGESLMSLRKDIDDTVSDDSGIQGSSDDSQDSTGSTKPMMEPLQPPSVIGELVGYTSKIVETKGTIESANRPREKWFVRGILTYRKPFRPIADSAVELSDYDCPLCLRMLWQPVTTTCGHTYCKMCLEQALDHKPSCPLCKSYSVKSFLTDRHEVSPNEFLDSSMRRLLPTEYNERKAVHEAEMREIGAGSVDVNVIPVFVCTISVPNIPCPLHIFEPRYRLMVRRAMESGARGFGMSCYVNDEAP